MKTKLIIFGISGDLSRRKLLPALQSIIATGEFAELEIIGVSRRTLDADEIFQGTDLKKCSSLYTMDVASSADYQRLKSHINLKSDEQALIYLSVPPSSATQIVDFLGEAGIHTLNTKLLFEKPFGVDLASATEMIERTSRYYSEEQIYRIDHYLAKEMAQNIVAFRGGNALFSHLWNNAAIEKIEIIASESIGIEGRGQFYEQTGALRDVVQGHLLQLLALVLMDIPQGFDWNALPGMRLRALAQLQLTDVRAVRRAQYAGYQDEVANPGSLTETFVSLPLISNDPTWAGVPITLTAGKALDQKTTEIRIHFRKFHAAQSNCLVLRIQPNEGIEIELFTKKPGYDRQFEMQKLAFTYPADTLLPDAYEQVLVDAIHSRKSLFTSSDEVLASWRLLQPIQDAWMMDTSPLPVYSVHSSFENFSTIKSPKH